MEKRAFVEDFYHCRKTSLQKTPFAEQPFAVHVLVEHLSMADPIKLAIM